MHISLSIFCTEFEEGEKDGKCFLLINTTLTKLSLDISDIYAFDICVYFEILNFTQ